MPNVFVLKDHLKKVEDFEVEIRDGVVKKLPHGNHLKREDLKLITAIDAGNADALYEFLGKFLGQEDADALNYGELEAIYQGWLEFIKASSGVSMGES